MKLPVLLFFTLLPGCIFSQNLLVNGNLEEENICIEYKVNCAPEGWISSSDGFNNYFKDAKRAHSGEHCMAIEAGFTGKSFIRTYIRSRLLCGLRKDHKYRVEFYIKSPHPILDSIGVLFTSYDFLFGQRRLQNITPSLYAQPANGRFSKDSSWQKVTMIYTAKGDESFMAIANFARRDIKGETSIRMEKHFFAFLDDISLTPVSPHETLCDEWRQNQQLIYGQDERHEFLRQLIRQNKDDPATVVLPSTKFVIVDTLVLPDVLFASGKADLQSASYKMLDSFCRRLTGKRIDSVVVEGHTDNTGATAFNDKLSVDRADAVKTAIQQRIGTNTLILSRGYGDRKPMTDNSTVTNRRQNRRVEMLVYLRE